MHQGNAQLQPALGGFLEDGRSFLLGHGPLVPMLSLAFIAFLVWLAGAGKREARKNFVRNTASKGESAISLTSEGLTIRNSEGGSSNVPWSGLEFWLEGANVIVLVFRSGVETLISLGMASEQQRNELRAILTQVLPKR